MTGEEETESRSHQPHAQRKRWVRIMTVIWAVVVVTGSLVTVAAQDTGSASLTVTAHDATGDLIQEGAVVLYTSEWDVVGEKTLNAEGQARWSGLSSGEYHLELYRTNGEFWGGTEITISDGEQREVTVQRTEPRVTSLELEEANSDGTYQVGEAITISPQVRNEQSFPRTVRVKIAVDTNNDSSPDETVNAGR